MNWFSKKKKEVYYKYLGVKDTELFRNNIEGFYEIHKGLINLNRVFTKNDIIEITRLSQESVSGINATEHLLWIESDKINERDNQIKSGNINFNIENIYKLKSIEINFDNLNQFFFKTEIEKNDLINNLNTLILECLSKKEITKASEVLSFFYDKNIDSAIIYNYIINIKQDIYRINKLNDLLYIDKQEELIASSINNNIKFLYLNLLRKIKAEIKDLSNEEKLINELFLGEDNIKDYIYYDYIESFKLLGKHYLNNDYNKGVTYFEKIPDISSKVSSNFTSSVYKEIGEMFLEIEKKQLALTWFKNGLDINPKLSVKKIIAKLEKEI